MASSGSNFSYVVLVACKISNLRIGVTGNSGRGTQTSLMMVCDARIAAAAPATFLMSANGCMHTGGAQDFEQIWPGMTAAGFEHEDILLIMVPRPALEMAIKSAAFFSQ